METIKPALGPGLKAGDDELVGRLAPQPGLSGGGRFDDFCGYRFAAIVKPQFRVTASGQLATLEARNVAIFAEPCAEVGSWLDANGVEGVIVRPDRYVLGSFRSVGDIEAVVAAI